VPSSLILMKFQPENAFKSEEASGEMKLTELPFISVLKYLEAGGIRVPALYGADVKAGLVFLEDLGDIQVGTYVKDGDIEARRKWYRKAIDILIDFQLHNSKSEDKDFIGYQREFDNELLMWECEHYLEWGIEALYDTKLNSEERLQIQKHFDKICKSLRELPQILVHRDFQSRNMMVLDGEELALIDFQDALVGPWPYDLVALLRDSYVDLQEELLDELIEYYCVKYEKAFACQVDKTAFMKAFYLQALQRKLKDSGRFVFIDRVKKNDSYLQFIPQSLSYVKHAFSKLPEYNDLQMLLSRYEKRLAP